MIILEQRASKETCLKQSVHTGRPQLPKAVGFKSSLKQVKSINQPGLYQPINLYSPAEIQVIFEIFLTFFIIFKYN